MATSFGVSRAMLYLVSLMASVVWAPVAGADYRYISGDPIATHASIVRDIQAERLDPRNLDPRVIQGIYQGGPMSPRPDVLYDLGPLEKICMSFAIAFPNGRKIVFRTIHSNGYGDWVVLVSENPEIVHGLTMLPLPRGSGSQGGGPPGVVPPVPMPGGGGPQGGGPPAVLPPVPMGDQSIFLPQRLDCTNANAAPRSAPQEELRAVCQQWPLMCRRN
jgi:hypothetical protein